MAVRRFCQLLLAVLLAAPVPALAQQALLFRDVIPWSGAGNELSLQEQGIPYDVLPSNDMDSVDLFAYDLVIVAGCQNDPFISEFNANLARFDQYARLGGYLVLHALNSGCWHSDGSPPPTGTVDYQLPGGAFTTVDFIEDWNYIVNPFHPVFLGVPNPYFGNYASHVAFGNLEPTDNVLATGGTNPGGLPTMFERHWFAGSFLVTGLTEEFGKDQVDRGLQDLDTALVLDNEIAWGWAFEPRCGPDADGDGVGDYCDPCPIDIFDDSDGDGLCDSADNCPLDFNPGQSDTDADGFGNQCDNCTNVPNDQHDWDSDGAGDDCDSCPFDAADDSDSDGVCDSDDVCAGFDDGLDADVDGVPDGCDQCAAGDDLQDYDGDGVANACDACPLDNPDDSDADTVCDIDDVCAGGDDRLDADVDGVPDDCDICPGGADLQDYDGDGVPNFCDVCPFDDLDDSDGDGVCDTFDVCPGFDDLADADGDTVPDGCDQCPGGSDIGDYDGDTVPDGCDPCPLDNPDDSDADGVCDTDDRCPGSDDAVDVDIDGTPDDCDNCIADFNPLQGDYDGDLVGDACDPCPLDNPDDANNDGVCDSDADCVGDVSTGDTDQDGICDDLDLCWGDDDSGDADLDGHCLLDIYGDVHDCDDADDTVYPGAPELCDGKDNACIGVLLDEEQDNDGDGLSICEGDCDDLSAVVSPDLDEVCDGLDNDCDGAPGEGEVDLDGDGQMVCEGDCDDAEPARSGFLPEICYDDLDNDCDDDVDEDCPDLVLDDQGGCYCDAGGGAAGVWLLLIGPAILRRRRR